MARAMTRQEFIDKLICNERDDIILIGDYVNTNTYAKFKCQKCGHEWNAKPRNILGGNRCPKCSRFKTHEKFIKDFNENGNPSLEILGHYINSKIPIKVRCKKCGQEFENTPTALLLGTGCLICSGHIVVRDINSVAALRPDLIKYFKNQDDAYCITPGSSKNVSLICPDCGAEKMMIMSNLSKRWFSCDICGDKISYPNKLIRNVMYQLAGQCNYVEFEWFEKWENKYIYDVYFEKNNKKYVIEMHGEQHYRGWKGHNVEEIQDNDNVKKNLAILNGVIPIIIDARKSDFDYIFNNISCSLLCKILDLSKIDCKLCKENSTKNIVKMVCQDYNAGVTTSELMDKYKLCRSSIVNYLHKGTELAWCNYIPKDSHIKSLEVLKKKVNIRTTDNDFLGTYNSIKEGIEYIQNTYNIKLHNGCVTMVCQGKRHHHRGFVFEYA